MGPTTGLRMSHFVATPALSSLIPESARSTYERDGVVPVRHVFDGSWVDFMREAVERAMVEPGPFAEEFDSDDGQGRFFIDVELALRLPPFERFVRESPAAELAAHVMGASRINYFDDHLLVKEPGTASRSPWHQDQPYWAVSGRQVCSVWLPLDPVPEDLSVEFVRGSHRWEAFTPLRFRDDAPYEGTGLPPVPDIEAHREHYDIARFSLEPGDCLVFQAMIVHGAPGNSGTHRRRALSVRWAGDDARYCVRPGEGSVPTENPGLADGDVLDCERFPVVWSARRD